MRDHETCGLPTSETTVCHAAAGHRGGCRTIPTIAEALDLEAEHLRPGAREEAIRVRFGLPLARWEQLLNRYIDTEEALAHNPTLVRGRRARREQIQSLRAARAC
jgi:hypothetical protein